MTMATNGTVDGLIPHNFCIYKNNFKGSATEKDASRQTDRTPLGAQERNWQRLSELFFLIIPTGPV